MGNLKLLLYTTTLCKDVNSFPAELLNGLSRLLPKKPVSVQMNPVQRDGKPLQLEQTDPMNARQFIETVQRIMEAEYMLDAYSSQSNLYRLHSHAKGIEGRKIPFQVNYDDGYVLGFLTLATVVSALLLFDDGYEQIPNLCIENEQAGIDAISLDNAGSDEVIINGIPFSSMPYYFLYYFLEEKYNVRTLNMKYSPRRAADQSLAFLYAELNRFARTVFFNENHMYHDDYSLLGILRNKKTNDLLLEWLPEVIGRLDLRTDGKEVCDQFHQHMILNHRSRYVLALKALGVQLA